MEAQVRRQLGELDELVKCGGAEEPNPREQQENLLGD